MSSTGGSSKAETTATASRKSGLEDPKSDPNCTTCTDFKDWFNMQTSQKGGGGGKSAQKQEPNFFNNSQNQKTTSQQQQQPTAASQFVPESQPQSSSSSSSNASYYDDCPLFRDQFGRAAWSYLHTMAVNYPEKPTEIQKTKMKDFIDTFTMFFPCKHCAEDFREELVFFFFTF